MVRETTQDSCSPVSPAGLGARGLLAEAGAALTPATQTPRAGSRRSARRPLEARATQCARATAPDSAPEPAGSLPLGPGGLQARLAGLPCPTPRWGGAGQLQPATYLLQAVGAQPSPPAGIVSPVTSRRSAPRPRPRFPRFAPPLGMCTPQDGWGGAVRRVPSRTAPAPSTPRCLASPGSKSSFPSGKVYHAIRQFGTC